MIDTDVCLKRVKCMLDARLHAFVFASIFVHPYQSRISFMNTSDKF
jgi:hypothetical protein